MCVRVCVCVCASLALVACVVLFVRTWTDLAAVWFGCSQFDAGHLPVAFHLDPELLSSPEELYTVVQAFKAMKVHGSVPRASEMVFH